jgi:hypothetical protein
MAIETHRFSFAITGADGSAASPTPALSPWSGNISRYPIQGRVLSCYVKYNTQPNTTDVVVKTKGDNGPSQSFLTLTNKNTDGLFYPRAAVHDTLGVAALYAAGGTAIVEPPVIDDYVVVTAAQGNAGTIDVWLTVER